ncbi:MAG: hypothetical protein KJ017_03785 [Alphaproteobacteria bacterium]|nr:hypothetical protein [Alphaproteobacteria bacterium]
MKRVRVLFGLLAASAVFSACAAPRPLPSPFIGNELPPIDPDKGRCIEVEREPGPEGGLRIPPQAVCPAFGVESQ